MKLVRGRGFTLKDEQKFRHALTARLGKSVAITIQYDDEISREKSGKFRIVKNLLTANEMVSESMTIIEEKSV